MELGEINRRMERQYLSRRRLMGASVLGAGLAGVTLVGCGGGSNSTNGTATGSTSANTTNSGGTPKQGGTLRLSSTGDTPSIDPFPFITQLAQTPAALWYSRLYRYKNGPDVQPRQYVMETDVAASMPEITDGGMTVIVKLRPDVKFHDKAPVNGRALVASDIAYTFQRFRTVSPRTAWFDVVDKLETPDDNTVTFKMKTPSASLTSTLTDASVLHIVPKEIVDAKSNTAGNPVGTGPWMFDTYQPNTQITAVANPNYFKPRPYIDKVQYQIIPEASAALAAYRSGQLDVLSPAAQDVDTVKGMGNTRVVEWGGSPSYLNFSLTGIFQDVRMRRALSAAMDREAINKAVYAGRGKPATFFPSDFTPWFIDPADAKSYPGSSDWLKYNPTLAKQLLQQAGYNGQPITFISSSFLGQDQFDLVNAMATAVGIKVNVINQDYPAFLASTNQGNFPTPDAFGLLPTAIYTDPSGYINSYFLPTSDVRKTHYVDDALGKMMLQQDQEFDQQKRTTIIQDIQRRFADQVYIVFLENGTSNRAISSRVQNYNIIDNAGAIEGFSTAYLSS